MQKSKIKNQKYRAKIKNILRFVHFAFWIVILHFTFYILHSPAARAQTFSLSISPPLLEVMIMPGKSLTQAYQLSNSGDEIEINTQIVTFKPADELGNIKLPITNYQLPITQNWFSFENADLSLGKLFLLKSGESKQIILRIKIPPKAEEDDYYFSLLFASSPQGRLGFSGTTQAGVIGTNILITVSRDGKPVKKGEIVEFKVKNSKFKVLDSFDKPEFLLRVKNTGRTFWKPFGKLRAEGLLGQKWEQELQPDNVLAGSIRQIQVATESASPSFLVGPYRAKAEFSLDEDEESQTLSAATSFLVLPIKALIWVFTSFLLLLIIKSVLFRRRT